MSNPNRICFLPETGDTRAFASSVAVNDKYLVVGDPGANRIVVYQKNAQGQWYREREIYPPENSIPYQADNGFGRNIRLDKNALLVDALSIEPIKKYEPTTVVPGSRGQYFIRLDRIEEPIPLDFPNNRKKGGAIQFCILLEDRPQLITLADNNEELFSTSLTEYRNFAVHKNLLLVGSPSRHVASPDNGSGKGWLFNIQALNREAIELSSTNAFIGDTVAISEQFAVVGNKKSSLFLRRSSWLPKTLIRSLKNDSTVVLDIYGKVSLDGNILAIMLPASRSQMRSSSLIKLFYLSENATSDLILERKYPKGEKYLTKALVQNGWLISVYRIDRQGSIKFCLESLEQIT